jgi:hypothetical protein
MDFKGHDPEGDSHGRDGTARCGFPAPPASADAASDPAGEPGVGACRIPKESTCGNDC